MDTLGCEGTSGGITVAKIVSRVLGSLQPGNPALVVAKSASIVLLVMRASTEGLGHLRDRVDELAAYVGDPSRDWTSVGVVLVAGPREETAVVQRTRGLLDSVGSPASACAALRSIGFTSTTGCMSATHRRTGPTPRDTGGQPHFRPPSG